ncbi:MAG TPA: hypothetical protein DCY97_14995 [Marinilabiliales bacterium]|nr:hypothetical protein [Marinilabiliales bacterium]
MWVFLLVKDLFYRVLYANTDTRGNRECFLPQVVSPLLIPPSGGRCRLRGFVFLFVCCVKTFSGCKDAGRFRVMPRRDNRMATDERFANPFVTTKVQTLGN